MIMDIECSSLVLNNFLYITKTILLIIMIFAPILAILSGVILFFKLTNNPEDKKLINKLKNAVIALVILFFIPLFVNLVVLLIGNKTDFTACYNSSKRIDSNSKYYKTTEDKEKEIISDPKEYEAGNQRQLDFSCYSKKLRTNFSCETIHIIERHLDDFNVHNFHSVINNYGGFENYVDSLGGIYSKYYGKQQHVSTAYQFQLVAEYVFGFMTMYGFDYYSGWPDDRKYCKWGGNCVQMDRIKAYWNDPEEGEIPSTSASDAYYPGNMLYISPSVRGLSDRKHFDNMIKTGVNLTTNCNWSVDMVFYKAGLFGTGKGQALDSNPSHMLKVKGSKVIYKSGDLKVGDVLAFFHNPIKENSSPSSWGSWAHAAFVGEVDKVHDKVTVYDGGSYFIKGKKHKWTMKISDDGVCPWYSGWVGIRIKELE